MTPINWIPLEVPGGLAVMARPRGGDLLQDEVRAWRSAGIDLIVSALEPMEESFLDLELEEETCVSQGIEFQRFPTMDRGVPPLDQKTRATIEELGRLVQDGRRVAIHCRLGIGRSGLLCASVLVTLGLDPEEAFRRVAAARGLPVPDTPEQVRWVHQFAASRIN
jgi:protein-tyrosine phosphatase